MMHPMPSSNQGSRLCCDESPFELGFASGDYILADSAQNKNEVITQEGGGSTTASVNIVVLVPPQLVAVAMTDLRFAWRGFPQCTLYNGATSSGADSHSGIAAAPFRAMVRRRQDRTGANAVCPSNTTLCTDSVYFNSVANISQCCSLLPVYQQKLQRDAQGNVSTQRVLALKRGEVCVAHVGCFNAPNNRQPAPTAAQALPGS
jgi:hypothetical protein